MPKRKRRSDLELKQGGEVIAYELAQFLAALEVLLCKRFPANGTKLQQACHNAFLHSFLLAARNLLQFAFSHDPYKDDIIAEDYFEDPEEWMRLRPKAKDVNANRNLANAINKRLAHMTYDRATNAQLSWKVIPIARKIVRSLVLFVSKISEPSQMERLGVALTTAAALLQTLVDKGGSAEDSEMFAEIEVVQGDSMEF